MPRFKVTLTGLVLITCAACAQFPEVDAATSEEARQADYPDLVPLRPLLSSAASTNPEPQDIRDQTEARRNALQARASRLRSVQTGDADADPDDDPSG